MTNRKILFELCQLNGDKLTATEMAYFICVERALICKKLNMLEKNGFVKSERLKQNNQRKYIITTKGKELSNLMECRYLLEQDIKKIR